MKRYLPVAIIAGVLILALGGGLVLWRSSNETTAEPFKATSPTPAAPRPTLGSTPVAAQPPSGADNPHSQGNPSAKVTLEEYGDYQCPSCSAVFHLLEVLEKDYDKEVRFVFRQFPLAGHKHAMTAAQAAEAAALQDKFWPMHDMIYQNQASWSVAEDVRPVFEQYAKSLGLDVERFKRDMAGPEVAKRVADDMARGQSVGVEGTPTIYINGRQVRPEVVTDPGLRTALDYMLGKKK